MHSAAESASQPRVPSGGAYSSLTASLSSVRVVYLNRFLTELLAYLFGGWGCAAWGISFLSPYAWCREASIRVQLKDI